MTLKKLIGAGLAGLAALAVAVLLIDPALAQQRAGGCRRAGDRPEQGRQRLDADRRPSSCC